jgi:hypothetical protein
MQSPCSLCVREYPPINFRMPEAIFMKICMYTMAPEPVSTAYFMNPSHQSVCLYVYLRVSLLGNDSVDEFPWQRLQAIIEEPSDVSFSIRSLSYQRKVCGSVYIFP